MPKVIKNGAIHLRMFAFGFCLTTFSAPPQILAASTVSSAQFQKRRNDVSDGFKALPSVCFEQ